MAENLNSYADSVIEQKSDKEVAGLDTRVTALEEGGGGGGGGGSFDPYIGIISYDETAQALACNKTFSEITSAVNAGKFIIQYDDGDYYLNGYLRTITDDFAVFMVTTGYGEEGSYVPENDLYAIMSDGTIQEIQYNGAIQT